MLLKGSFKQSSGMHVASASVLHSSDSVFSFHISAMLKWKMKGFNSFSIANVGAHRLMLHTSEAKADNIQTYETWNPISQHPIILILLQ